MKAFVCHYSPLKDRRAYLESVLPDLGFSDVEWVTENDIGRYDTGTSYDASPQALALRNATVFSKFGMKRQRPLSKAEIEITLQHIECFNRIAAQKPAMAAIFEDDVRFKKKFKRFFSRFIDELPPAFDVFYFGKGCGHHRSPMSLSERMQNILGKKYVFKNKECRSRFTDSYVVSAAAAQKLFTKCFPFHLVIDWELNYLQSSMAMEIYWSEPTLTFQGSKYGYYKSSLKEEK
jgi:GR25 family glycosyltransferase involved in LPS biosynthesis